MALIDKMYPDNSFNIHTQHSLSLFIYIKKVYNRYIECYSVKKGFRLYTKSTFVSLGNDVLCIYKKYIECYSVVVTNSCPPWMPLRES